MSVGCQIVTGTPVVPRVRILEEMSLLTQKVDLIPSALSYLHKLSDRTIPKTFFHSHFSPSPLSLSPSPSLSSLSFPLCSSPSSLASPSLWSFCLSGPVVHETYRWFQVHRMGCFWQTGSSGSAHIHPQPKMATPLCYPTPKSQKRFCINTKTFRKVHHSEIN